MSLRMQLTLLFVATCLVMGVGALILAEVLAKVPA